MSKRQTPARKVFKVDTGNMPDNVIKTGLSESIDDIDAARERRLRPDQSPTSNPTLNGWMKAVKELDADGATILFTDPGDYGAITPHQMRLTKEPNGNWVLSKEAVTPPSVSIQPGGDLTGAIFVNGSRHEFTDISSEEWREYVFADGTKVRIEGPTMLNVSGNGHRLFDAEGVSHYVPAKWVHIKWRVKTGQPHFVA